MDQNTWKERIVAKYGDEFVATLGTQTDRAIADKFNIDHSQVLRIRHRMGIPAMTEVYPERVRRSSARIVMLFASLDEMFALSDAELLQRCEDAREKYRAVGQR